MRFAFRVGSGAAIDRTTFFLGGEGRVSRGDAGCFGEMGGYPEE